MELYIGRILYPVKTLGPGERLGIWFSGCSIRCRGCMSRELWERKPYQLWDGDKLRRFIFSLPPNIDKATISGGEPFDQPEALLFLLRLLKEKGFSDIWIFSGYKYETLKEKFSQHLELADVLIDGPFVESLPTDLIWRGSSNQRMILLSPKARKIHRKWVNFKVSKRELQVVNLPQGFLFVGILKAGDWKWR